VSPTAVAAKSRVARSRPTAGPWSGALHDGLHGPGAPGFSKLVDSTPAAGSVPSQSTALVAPTARVTSAGLSAGKVAVHAAPAPSYWSVPSSPTDVARRVRRPLSNSSADVPIRRTSSESIGSGAPLRPRAVPCTTTRSAEAAAAASVMRTSAVVVAWALICAPVPGSELTTTTRSPERMSGVTVDQHAPPGWFTSTMPPLGVRPLDRPIMLSPRQTSTSTRVVSDSPSIDTKSRSGNTTIAVGASGGSTIPGGSAAPATGRSTGPTVTTPPTSSTAATSRRTCDRTVPTSPPVRGAMA
jgi:hypothetical protein